MFIPTDITGAKLRKNDVFVTVDRHEVMFARVVGKRHDAKAGVVSVVTVNDIVNGNGPVVLGDVHNFVVSDAETLSVVR